MDERHFSYYDVNHRLQSQTILLDLLEKKGLEKKGTYILTTDNIGIPVTSMLLLIRDSFSYIDNEQKEFLKNENNKIVDTLNLENLCKETKTSFDPMVAGLSPDIYWDKCRIWDINPSPTVSGSVVAYQSILYKPQQPIGSNLTEIFKAQDKSNVRIYKSVIHVPTVIESTKNMIQIYKNIILFSELMYALQQRVIVERRTFENVFHTKIAKIQSGNNFKSVCGKRSGIIHGGSFKLRIKSETSTMTIGNNDNDICDIFSKSFDEAISWIDQTYCEMMNKL